MAIAYCFGFLIQPIMKDLLGNKVNVIDSESTSVAVTVRTEVPGVIEKIQFKYPECKL